MKNFEIYNTTLVEKGNHTDATLSSIMSVACNVFAPLMYTNLMSILIFSTLWAFYLSTRLWKDYRRERITSKLRNSYPEYILKNAMENFRSNRIKNTLLLAICLSELGVAISIVFSVAKLIPFSVSEGIGNQIKFWLQNPFVSFPKYENLVGDTPYRFANTFTTISICSMAFFIRILTQYMVYQYSYYKPYLNLKFQVTISLTCLLCLFFMAMVFQLIMIYNICIVLILFYEYLILLFESRKLCLLLQQHLHDAILHENQSKSIILYYRIVYKDYKYCSTIMLIALIAQFMGTSLYLLNQLVDKLFEDEYIYSSVHEYISIDYTETGTLLIELIMISIGTSIQILTYSIVTIRRIFRYIYKRIKLKHQASSIRAALQPLIEENNSAYINKR